MAISTLAAPGQVGAYNKTKDLCSGGHWSKEEQEDRIYVLELRAIFLGSKALCGTESNTQIQLYCDNTSSYAYLRNFWEKRRYLNLLAIDIRHWCVTCNIHLSISHVTGFLNVEAQELPMWLNLNKSLNGLKNGHFSRLCVGLTNPTLTFLHQGSSINM